MKMDKVEFINSELKEEMETQKQIKEKTADILDGLTERLDKTAENADHLFFLYLIEFISAIIIRMDGLNERINFLEEQNNV
jgi:DNA polymerase sigma